MSSVRLRIELKLLLTFIIIERPDHAYIQLVLSFVYLAVIYDDFEGHNHFANYHGENCVRLMVEQTVHDWKYKQSLWMVVLAPLLFFDPVTQVQELHKIFVDELVSAERWNAFGARFKGQLQNSNLMVNLSFHCRAFACN